MPVFRTASRERGFSIIEALIAIVIMAAVCLALLGVIPYGFNEIQVNATQVQAVALGQQYLDALRNDIQTNVTPLPAATTAPVDQGNSFVSGLQNSSASVFTITPNACPTLPPQTGVTASQYDCAVTVTWTENSQGHSIKVESHVTK